MSSSTNIPDPDSIPLPDLDPNSIPLPDPEPKTNPIPDPISIPLPKEGPVAVLIEDKAAQREKEMMAKIMGFSDFDSTKGKKVSGNQIGAVHVVKKRRYRQYMNRKGGFNRPLDKVA